MCTPRLIFFPANANQIISTEILLSALIKSEFVHDTAYSDNHFLPGENFLSLLTFLGCSPNINLHPDEGEKHCSISLYEITTEVNCFGYTNTVNPKCPDCKKRIADWKTSSWQIPEKNCICDKCQTSTPYAELNWKHECAFGRCGFEVNNIYPHEAVPTDQLLNILEKDTGFKWDYSYSNNI
ncbi:MAG: hypothetical protein DIZ80_03440 [endosymbiont of Galathealinum brachiosum]|uniref:Uncharacterized protein n=1 Tax=endosymbiont of Galathealinum brachiosum TaxID=2200906 RepID=A0A370DHY5_9GAMM|nr:MAG: hypothetical protein DIZ80_03440 [endosymbiont of Galathealinum brachiosum]